MGASGWRYVEPWAGSVEETFAAVQAREFASFFRDAPAEQRPADLAELWSGDTFDETSWAGFMAAQGTHSIVDIRRFVSAEADLGSPQAGSTMRLVPAAEVDEVFGHPRPTRAEFEKVPESSPLFQVDGRGMGRCAILYDADAPVAVAFWGNSGD